MERIFMKTSEIWLVDLDPAKGSEIRKTRACVIVSSDAVGRLPLRIVVPLTDWKDRYDIADWHVKIEVDNKNNLLKTSSADCFQVRSVSEKRLKRKTGELEKYYMDSIKEALALVLEITDLDEN